jgi:hypothetical protein
MHDILWAEINRVNTTVSASPVAALVLLLLLHRAECTTLKDRITVPQKESGICSSDVLRTGEVTWPNSLTARYGQLPPAVFSRDSDGNWKGGEHAFNQLSRGTEVQEHPEMFLPVPIYMTILVLTGWAVLGRKI